jgi:hypothetical protein
LLWAWAGLAGSKKEIAAAEKSQIGSKRSFLVIIPGIPYSLSRSNV